MRGKISRGLLRRKLEMHMTFENRPYLSEEPRLIHHLHCQKTVIHTYLKLYS